MILKQLIELKKELVRKELTLVSTRLFAGAGLVIANGGDSQATGNYVYVRTKYAIELSALVFRLMEIFREEINSFNKYAFFMRLGEAANWFLENTTENDEVLLAVLDEAIILAGEIETMKYFAYGSNMNAE